MKVLRTYISAAVSMEKLKEQFAEGVPEDVFEELIRVDPTANFDQGRSGKYCPWIFRQYTKGNLTEDDFQNLKDALDYFKNNARRFEHTDLGQYKTVEDFLNDAERVGNTPLTDKEKARARKKAAHNAGDKDKKFLAKDGVWELWTPLTHEGSISLARTGGHKARWCTAYEDSDHYWKYYTTGQQAGTLYIFLNTTNPDEKYQLHLESKSWYDIEDGRLGMENFYKFLADKPVFADYFKVETINGMTLTAGSVMAIPDDLKDVVIPDSAKTVSNGIRYPRDMERIVFPDSWETLSGPSLTSCSNLKFIHFPEALLVIPRNVANGCRSLQTIQLSTELVEIGAGAFKGCSSLTGVELPDTLEIIGEQAFAGCTLLSDIELPESITNIKDGAFDDIEFESFRFPSSMTRVPDRMFAGAAIMDLDFNNVTTVGAYAFYLADLDEVAGLENITEFQSCSFKSALLTELELNPAAILHKHAFAECSELGGTVTLGPDITFAPGKDDEDGNNSDVFKGCKNLTVVWNRPDAPYKFTGIRKLICPKSCTQLLEVNTDIATEAR